MYISATFFAAAFLTLANGSLLEKRLSGQGTFYGGNVAGGSCSFSTYTLPSKIFGTALSDSNWDNSAECGACVSVTGPAGNNITAMIVDQCPGCGLNHLDLFPDAFAKLANLNIGVIDLTWDYVDCPITSALLLHNDEGVSEYWFSMQVVNANKAISSLVVSTDGGSIWQTTNRQSYNFFEISSGTGTTTVDIKVISVDGDVVIVNDVTISSGASTTASGNFGSSGTFTSAVGSIVRLSTTSTPLVNHTTTFPTQQADPTTSWRSVASTSAPVETNPAETSTSDAPLPNTPSTAIIPTSSAAAAVGGVTSTVSPLASTFAKATSTPPSYTSQSIAASSVSIFTIAISTCAPIVVYSIVTVAEVSSNHFGTDSISYAHNVTAPTATPSTFTGSASGLQSIFGIGAFATIATIAAFFL